MSFLYFDITKYNKKKHGVILKCRGFHLKDGRELRDGYVRNCFGIAHLINDEPCIEISEEEYQSALKELKSLSI